MKVSVEFTNGTEVVTEFCIPQNMDGFYHWYKGRIEAMNTADEFDAAFAQGDTISMPTEDVAQTQTPEQEAAYAWYDDYRKLEKAQKLADIATKAGKAISSERKLLIDELAQRVDDNFLPEYIDMV